MPAAVAAIGGGVELLLDRPEAIQTGEGELGAGHLLEPPARRGARRRAASTCRGSARRRAVLAFWLSRQWATNATPVIAASIRTERGCDEPQRDRHGAASGIGQCDCDPARRGRLRRALADIRREPITGGEPTVDVIAGLRRQCRPRRRGRLRPAACDGLVRWRWSVRARWMCRQQRGPGRRALKGACSRPSRTTGTR